MTSDEDVIRAINEAVEAGDMQAASEWMHPDLVWEHNIGTGSPEEGTYRGRENVTELFERIVEPWEYMRLVPLEVREVGPSRYEIRGELHAKHETANREVVTPYEQHIEIGDGLLVKSRIVTARVS